MVNMPEGVRNVHATDVRPAVVRLELQRLATRTVPVRPHVGARSLQRYVVGESPEVIPATVRLTGPEDALARIDAIPTRSFEIVPDDSAFSQRVNLDTTGLHGITLSTQEVRVRGRVERRIDRVFAVVPVAAPEGVATDVAQVQVRVAGPDRLVREIAPPSLRAVARRDSLPARLPPGGVPVTLVVEGLPAGVRAATTPRQVRVFPASAATATPPTVTPPAGAPFPAPSSAPPVVPPSPPAAPPTRPR